MGKIDIDVQRAAFQLALVAGAPHLRPNFARVEVESGYGGYKEPLMEATFAGWLLREREAFEVLQKMQPLKYAAICDIQQRWRNVKQKEVFWIIRDVERAHGIPAKSEAGIPATAAEQGRPASRSGKSQ